MSITKEVSPYNPSQEKLSLTDKTFSFFNGEVINTLEIKDVLKNFLDEIRTLKNYESNEINNKIKLGFLEELKKDLTKSFGEFLFHDLGEGINQLISIYENNLENDFDYIEIKLNLYKKIEDFLEYCLLIVGEKVYSKMSLDNFKEELVNIKYNFLKNNKKVNLELNIDINLVNKEINIVKGYINILLENILKNSIKHGKSDKININLEKEDGNLVIEIKDNGSGINVEKFDLDINKIFIEGKSTGSTGLGLANSDKYMEEMDGEINVENMEFGTKFIIKLPLVK
ncbi:MAG: sensor histidine kinase [Candidatus Gracilibacteria bacterium]|nr:sensor histidine kinase [Candidatus Gracilibacteria bacterium]MDQ7023756.1 sensor histidine kinase [Candidatus Gracilibacteria bacterium]